MATCFGVSTPQLHGRRAGGHLVDKLEGSRGCSKADADGYLLQHAQEITKTINDY